MNRNLTWHVILPMVLFVMVALTVGCFSENCNITQSQLPIPIPSASPSPSPSPSPSTSPGANQIRSVQINGFGEQSCPAGVVPSCTDGATCRTLRLRCSRAFTCSAFTATGQDAGSVIPGLAPTLFDAVTGKGTVVQIDRDQVNPLWNLHATGLSVGSARLECTVGGVSTDPGAPFILTVVP